MKQSDRLLKAARDITGRTPKKGVYSYRESPRKSITTPKRARECPATPDSKKSAPPSQSPIGKILPHTLEIHEAPSRDLSPFNIDKVTFVDRTENYECEPVSKALFACEDSAVSAQIKDESHEQKASVSNVSPQSQLTLEENRKIDELCHIKYSLNALQATGRASSDSFYQPFSVSSEEVKKVGRAMSVDLPSESKDLDPHASDDRIEISRELEAFSEFKHLQGKYLRTMPLGMRNTNKYCYAISLLAAIRSVPSMYHWITTKSETAEKESVLTLLCDAFQQTLETGADNNESIKWFDPSEILQVLGKGARVFCSNEEEDVHEGFLALNEIIEISTRSFKCPNSWNSIFTWKFEYSFSCISCAAVKSITEETPCLSLPVPFSVEASSSSRSYSLAQLVREHLSSSEKILCKCDECGHERGTIVKKVAKYPKVMVVHLLRFKALEDSAKPEKIHTEIHASPVLPLHDSQSKHEYSFRASISHFGSTIEAGHYICDFLHPRHVEIESCDAVKGSEVTQQPAKTRQIVDVLTQNDEKVISASDEGRAIAPTLLLRSPSSYLLFYERN